MKFRPNISLMESLRQAVDLHDRQDLLEHLRILHRNDSFMIVTSAVKVVLSSASKDPRTGWSKTYNVTIEDTAGVRQLVGFTDGPA